MIEEKKIDEKKILDEVFGDRDTYQQATLETRNVVNDIYSSYIGQIHDTTPEDKSKSKENTNRLRTEVAYIVPSIFSGSPEFELEGVGEEDKDLAQVLEKIVNHRFHTIPQCYEKIEAWVKQSVVFGTSLIKVCWKFITKDNEDGSKTPIIDAPDLEVPNILDSFYNPLIQDVENQNSLVFRSVLPVAEVRNNEMYGFTDALGELNREKVESKGKTTSSKYDSSNQAETDKIDIDKASDKTVEVYEWLTKDRIRTVVDGKERLVLRDEPLDYDFINAVKLTHEPNCIPNRFEGFGVGHNTIGIGKLYNKMMNRTLDNVNLTNNPYFMFRKGSVPNKRQLVVRTGGGLEIETEGPLSEAVQAIQFPDIKQGAIEIMNKIDDEHKRASGANDLLQGSASNKTLGQDEIASTYSSNRFELINRRFKEALADVATMLLKLELKNLQSPDAEILRIFPEEIRQGVYELLINEAPNIKWNIKVKGNTNIAKNKDRQIQQIMETYNSFAGILPPKNQMAWARKILELRGVDEIDVLIPTEEELQMQEQQMQDMQQMQPM
jgi:hypothetical protein